MKKWLLVLMIICSYGVQAKMFDGILYLKDGNEISALIEVPRFSNTKNIQLEIGGKEKQIESDKVRQMDIFIDEKKYTFVYTNFKMYSKNKEFVKKRKFWFLKSGSIKGELEHFICSSGYKVNGKNELLIVSNNTYTIPLYGVKKKSDEIIVTPGYGNNGGKSAVLGRNKLIRNLINHYLSDCERLMKALDDVNEYRLEDICTIYNECNN